MRSVGVSGRVPGSAGLFHAGQAMYNRQDILSLPLPPGRHNGALSGVSSQRNEREERKNRKL